MKKIVRTYETDWLGFNSVFYNEKTGEVGHNINDVIDHTNIALHPEGFNNYLQFGYSVFEQTAIQDVKFLRHSSRLIRFDDGSFEIEYLEDPVLKYLSQKNTEQEALDIIEKKINEWEDTVQGTIIIPTSGGYDSRLLNYFVRDKNRIRAFTYGISTKQRKSFEVTYAQELCRRLNIQWEQVTLGNYNTYIDDWYNIFGASTHAHGMYHMDFYNKIKGRIGTEKANIMSGIIGDIWAGSLYVPEIKNVDDITYLSHTHGLNIHPRYSKYICDTQIRTDYLDNNKNYLYSYKFRIIEAMRAKIMLLKYLCVIPDSVGFNTWSPFLDIDVAMAMLSIPQHRRKKRSWQKDFFVREGLDIESSVGNKDFNNTLNLDTMIKHDFDPLNVDILESCVSSSYVEEVNSILKKSKYTLKQKKRIHLFLGRFNLPKLVLQGLRVTNINPYHLRNRESWAYNAYLVLKPIEMLLKKRI